MVTWFGVWGLGFGVWGLVFGVWGLGFGVWGLGSGVQDLEMELQGVGWSRVHCMISVFESRVSGDVFRVLF